MKHLPTLPQILRLALVAACLFAAANAAITAWADDAKTGVQPKPAKKLTGAELYTINCNRCHAERYPTEFTAGQWSTLMTHMRVRANLPATQAKEILKYMKEEAGK